VRDQLAGSRDLSGPSHHGVLGQSTDRCPEELIHPDGSARVVLGDVADDVSSVLLGGEGPQDPHVSALLALARSAARRAAERASTSALPAT